jgi:hypothetical protein
MALERPSFSLVDLLDFIVTVNKGIEAPDCWIFLLPTFYERPSRLLIIYEQFAEGGLARIKYSDWYSLSRKTRRCRPAILLN